jgi:DNA-binding NarL/FixJ family response regulator
VGAASHVLDRLTVRRPPEPGSLALIDGKSAAAFVTGIEMTQPGLKIEVYASVEDWELKADRHTAPVAILFNIDGRAASDPEVTAEIARLVRSAAPRPAIVLARSDELSDMRAAVDAGARGYVPAKVGIDVIPEAARLTSAGGIFLPTASAASLQPPLAS